MTSKTPKNIVPENVRLAVGAAGAARLERAQRGLDGPARHSRVPICPRHVSDTASSSAGLQTPCPPSQNAAEMSVQDSPASLHRGCKENISGAATEGYVALKLHNNA